VSPAGARARRYAPVSCERWHRLLVLTGMPSARADAYGLVTVGYGRRRARRRVAHRRRAQRDPPAPVRAVPDGAAVALAHRPDVPRYVIASTATVPSSSSGSRQQLETACSTAIAVAAAVG
jgi:hypothetical protein